MSDHITIVMQDANTGVRVRAESWEGLVHLTFFTYHLTEEADTAEPSITPEGARSLAAILTHLAEVAA